LDLKNPANKKVGYLEGNDLVLEQAGSLILTLKSINGGQEDRVNIDVTYYNSSVGAEDPNTIKQFELESIYPNPVSSGSELVVKTKNRICSQINLIEMNGQRTKLELVDFIEDAVKKQYEHFVNLPRLKSGIYLIELKHGGLKRSTTQRIFVE
jgi:hypothetical protein